MVQRRINKITIVDTTLRDGEQMPGIAFSYADKKNILESLIDAGVKEAEIGCPASGDDEAKSIKKIVSLKYPVRLTAWCRAVENDILKAYKTGIKNIHISFLTSDILLGSAGMNREKMFGSMKSIITDAKKMFDFVSAGAQDASRTDYKTLGMFIKKCADLKIDRVRISDTVGCLTPLKTFALIRRLKKEFNVPMEFHGHNDLGMATANTVTAINAGIDAVSVTVNGMGERAGNASLEEVAAASDILHNACTGIKLDRLISLSHLVSKISGVALALNKPVTGGNAFRHESGIHCSALIKNKYSYQLFVPGTVGGKEEDFIIGKHSGQKSLKYKLDRLGINLNEGKCLKLLKKIKKYSSVKKSIVTDGEIRSLIKKI